MIVLPHPITTICVPPNNSTAAFILGPTTQAQLEVRATQKERRSATRRAGPKAHVSEGGHVELYERAGRLDGQPVHGLEKARRNRHAFARAQDQGMVVQIYGEHSRA